MSRVKVTPSWLKTGFILEESDKNKSWDTLFSEQPLFRYLTSYVFNGVSNTRNMRETRKVMRKLISLDQDEINEGIEKDYDLFLESFLSILEKAPLVELVEQLELKEYVTKDGKNRAFSESLRRNMAKRDTKLIDLNNDLKVSQLLGDRYGKGLDDTERKTKRAQKNVAEKYESRSSRLLGAFDRSEPVLYPSTLSKHMKVSGDTITIDTEAYFTELFRVEGYGKIGTDTFQFNYGGSSSFAQDKSEEQDKADGWAESKFPDKWQDMSSKEKLDRFRDWKKEEEEASQEELEGFYEDKEDDDKGITVDEEKMLTKAQTSNALVTLKISDDHTYVLDVFGDKQYFDDEDAVDNREELWDAIDDVTSPTKKEIMEIVKSQRKSFLKDSILDSLTPHEHKIQIGKLVITLNTKEWKDEEKFLEWIMVGAGKSEDKKTASAAKDMAKRIKKLSGLLDQLKSKWGSYVYSEKESPYDKFMQLLLPKTKKELIDFFSQLIVGVKQDKYNLDNPKQADWTHGEPLKIPQELEDLIPTQEKLGERVIEGESKPIGIEEPVYETYTDEDGKTKERPVKDKKGKQVIEIKNYYPAFGNHDALVSILEAIVKNIKSGDYREQIKFIPFLEYADNENELKERISEQLLEAGHWIGDENSPQYRFKDSTVNIMTFSTDKVNKILVDTKIGRRSSKGFTRGRFSESGAGQSEAQKEKRSRNDTDKQDAEELTLVYHEYTGLKQLIVG